METRPALDADKAIAEARGFASVAEWREFRDATPERRDQMMREMRSRKRDKVSAIRHDLEMMRLS